MKFGTFSNGTKIIHESNVINELPTILVGLNAKRIMLVGNAFLHDTGYIDKIKATIESHEGLCVSAMYLGNKQEDNVSGLNDMFFVYMSNSCDSIVVCGSGKLIDYAKTLRLLASTQISDIQKFFELDAPTRQSIYVPFVVLPTKFGIGNASNSTAIVYDSKRGISRNIVSNILLPDYCLIDEENLSRMDKKLTAYSILEVLARAIDGYTSKNSPSFDSTDILSKALDSLTGKAPASISDGFCRVALTDLKANALSLLEDPTPEKYVKMQLTSAYLSKGTDSSGLGLIHCLAQAISDVKKVEYRKALPKAIRVALRYNLDDCKQKYAQCLLAFMGWEVYSKAPRGERHYEFARYVLAFVDELSEKYLKGETLDYFNEQEKVDILNNIAYNVHILNNPRKINTIALKMAL